MRAVVYNRDTRKAGLGELPVPMTERPGEVLFHPSFAAICGSDLHMFLGSDGYSWVRSPLVLGHEAVGTIPGEEGLFLLDPYIPCGACKMCRMGNTSTCMGPGGGRGKESPPWSLQYGFRRHGGMAETVAVERGNLVPVPPGLSPRLAALAESVAVSWHGVEAGMRLLSGTAVETAAVLGPGPIGLSASLALSARSLRTAVLGLPRDAERLRRAGILGAEAAVDDARALEATVDDWTNGAGVDLVIEATGTEEAWETAISAVRRGGTIVCLGIPHGRLSLKVREVVRGGVVVTGSYGVTPSDLAAALALLEEKEERGMALLDRTFPLTEADEAFPYATRSGGKVLLSMGAEDR
jgi:L-iditol 2-dehydrogenase